MFFDCLFVVSVIIINIYIYIYICTLPFKSLGSVRFFMFLMESLLLIKAVFIRSKYRKNIYILKSYCEFLILVSYFNILSV